MLALGEPFLSENKFLNCFVTDFLFFVFSTFSFPGPSVIWMFDSLVLLFSYSVLFLFHRCNSFPVVSLSEDISVFLKMFSSFPIVSV